MHKHSLTRILVTEEEDLHKGYDRFQKILSQLNQVQARPDNDDINLKFLRALPSSWSTSWIGHSFIVKKLCSAALILLHWNYQIGSKPTYSDQQLTVPSVSQTSWLCSENIIMSFAFIVLRINKSKYDLCRLDQAGEMHAVPPSITGTYMPSPYKSDIEETHVSSGSKSDTKKSETLSETNDFVSCDNSDKSSDSATYASCESSLKTKTKDFPPTVDNQTLPESDIEDPNSTAGSPSFSCSENVKSPRIICNKSGVNNRKVCKNNFVRVKKCFVCGSKLHLIKDCDFYNCVDSVPCKSKAASVSAGSRISPASVPAGRSDSAASRNRPAVHSAGAPNHAGWSKRPATVSAGRPGSAGWLNPAARPYFRPSSVYFNTPTNLYDPMFMDKGRWDTAGDPSTDNDIGIVDSGCSRSMTGNKEKLADFVPIKGGIVKFGGGDGRISGKGTIRTSKLDFENVYYVEELQHFNLFSVSQICDKKNKVLFTDTDCLVLSEEFQLPDASQVVLRIPRKHDLYTFHISHLQPEQKVTCLVAKASLDESTRWHRRMAHVNFKTINKLAKEGLVDGLPLKVFTNEHNCVACNKGKQHKASYKHISAVRLITESLQLLHMDLFGPTNIRSIDQKYYSLVVTDDFSRFSWTFFLGTKDETFYVLKEFITLIENQLNKKVKGIRCDNGTEFKNAKLIELCGEKGIKREAIAILELNKKHHNKTGDPAGIEFAVRILLACVSADGLVEPADKSNSAVSSSVSADSSLSDTNSSLVDSLVIWSPVSDKKQSSQSKFGERCFSLDIFKINNGPIPTDQLHCCLLASFLKEMQHSSTASMETCPSTCWLNYAIGTKLDFEITRGDAGGIVVREFNAMVVAQDHRQEEGLITMSWNVKSASLYGEIEEVVVVTQPKGFEIPTSQSHFSACSRHQVIPLTSHLNAVKKIFKYLKGQPKLGLWYPKDSPFQLEAYSDNDYVCKKQTIVATSSTGKTVYVAELLAAVHRASLCNCEEPCFSSEDHAYEIMASLYIGDVMRNTWYRCEIHTDENWLIYWTKAFGLDHDLSYLVVHLLGW
ncbi:putative ribonuclease H-like domain-containing protein [Tanacetum coccineum]|uniref:Ribonuclease H-like domain-containing protein n=1 Tax=Tanacetum coccineum TaxID=301880 RepID=A0ABQ5B924_9ASTR